MELEVIMNKKKNAAAAYIRSECCRTSTPETLKLLLDSLLDPQKKIDNDSFELIEWIKWLMAGGCSPEEFTANVRKYDNATTCGLVWTANFVAYRCRTCGISPCMSLCAECFQRGNHTGHDFNMFRSQAGGACDCGDMNVMKESGFCYLHGPHSQNPNLTPEGPNAAPPDLLCVASQMMPRLILRLIQHMRDNSNSLSGFLGSVQDADGFITMLHEMSGMGAAMRQVMTYALTNPQIYKNLTNLDEIDSSSNPAYYEYMSNSKFAYEQALRSLPNPTPPHEYSETPALLQDLVHRTFLEEFVFWTAKFEFPQKIVCLLLNLLPDEDYKEAFTRAFVLHYGRISQLLVQSTDPDMLSNRVVHVSVQLFSNEKLALRMAEQMGLLHVMVISLTYMMKKITVPCTLSGNGSNFHLVVDCGNQCMKDHCYWPLVSDLNNILSHRPVALRFLEDDGLLSMWFNFLSLFQGMNTNQRELHQHVEYEPTTYYAAFSTELEASASPMWALVSHLRDASTAHLTKNLIKHCKEQLKHWFEQIGFNGQDLDDDQVSFHLPLHRYLAVFLYQAVRNQGLSLEELLPSPKDLRAIIQHPLRVQTGFYEIISGLWVRNGLQIKGQAMTYVQCHFCNSMVDADLFLLQVAMMNLPYDEFISTVLNRFNVMESLSMSDTATNAVLDKDHEILMLENCLIFLASLASVRTSIGMSDSDLVSLEMVTLLCMGDKTHSQLMELMPERCGNSSQSKDFETVLSKVADYRAPNFEHGNMVQGMYVPKPFVWESLYDPIYILLRAVHRKDFQTSLDRFSDFAKQTGKFKGPGTPWPPFRIPELADAPYTDPRFVLQSKVFHSLLFVIFFKAMNSRQSSDQLVSFAVYLLELALSVTEPIGHDVMSSIEDPEDEPTERFDMLFTTWFSSDCLLANVRTEIDTILVKPSGDEGIGGSDSSDDEERRVDEGMEVETYDVAVELFDELRVVMANQATGLTTRNAPRGSLAIMPPGERPRPRDVRALINEGTPGTLSRDDQIRSRNLQMVLHSPKPVIRTHKKGIGISSPPSGVTNEIEVGVNESIISLLLKLHAKLSSCPDSYTPYWETPTAQRIIAQTKDGISTGLDPATFMSDQYTTTYTPLFYTQLFNVLTKMGIYQSRIGDGPFFIANVLDKLASKDVSCREYIIEVKGKLWPREMEAEEEKLLREAAEESERKKKASERRRQATEDMQRRQQAFLEKMKSEMDSGSNPFGEGEGEEGQEMMEIKPVEYHCVICNLTGPSTASNPIGLVILLQATSVLGHRRKKDSPTLMLPTTDEERSTFLSHETMSGINEKRLRDMTSHFDDDSWLMAMSGGWDGGVHVQTCGHHIHHECLRDYHTSLRTQQRQHNISIDRGEYFCPLCRQLANSFLPLSSEFGIRKSALVKDRTGSAEPMTPETTIPQIVGSAEGIVALEILKLLKEYPLPTDHSKMVDAMAKAMEEMTNATSLKYRKIGTTTNTKSILLFVNSIARTNLEMELVLSGGNLVSIPTDPQPSTSTATQPKRSCIVPLLHVLGVHYKILSTDQCLPKTWERILGIRFFPDSQVITPEREVSLLLRDPISTLIHFLMNLPMHVDSAYFDCLVQALYNHVYIQALCSVSSRLSDKERTEWKAKKSLFPASSSEASATPGEINQLEFLLGTVITYLGKSTFYLGDSDSADMDYESHGRKDGSFELNEDEIENELESLVLPFLRIAALLRHHLYDQELPFIATTDEEFSLLGQYLRLGLSESTITNYSTLHDGIKAHHFLFWISPTPLTAIWTWCEDLCNFVGTNHSVARFLLNTQNLSWSQPKILDLPEAYQSIFKYFHQRQCPKCNLIPKDPSVCLLCATMVCLRDSCCKQQNIFEATQHAINCGAGTAIYLSVNSSTIVVIRGKRACLWGSVYLDSFGEEDRELKRGKPLFLSRERYALLQQQWLTHRFDHSPRKWIFHRDAL